MIIFKEVETLEISDMFLEYSISPKPIKHSFDTEWNQFKSHLCLHEIDIKYFTQTFTWFVRVMSLPLGLPP